MAGTSSEEIDTLLEASEGKAAASVDAQIEKLSADISIASELESDKAELAEAAILPEKTFFFPDFPRKVYCTVSGLRVRLIQTGEGRGIAYLTFTQTCNSQRSTVAKGADWSFTVRLYDAQGANLRSIYLGAWNHRCGKHFVELREDFGWVHGSINPLIHSAHANLNWQHLQRVKNCG